MVIEDFEEDSEAEGSGGEDDIRELRAKKLALARKIAEQQRRQEKIQVGPAGVVAISVVLYREEGGVLGVRTSSTL